MAWQTNHFAAERVKYQPPLPSILQHIDTLEKVEGEKTLVRADIVPYFSKTSALPIIHFLSHRKKSFPPLRVGVVLSGGQAAGGHNVIIGLYEALRKLNPGSQLFGFVGGPNGIIENHFTELTAASLLPFRNTGGFDLIGSGRTKIETPEQFDAARKHCHALKLDGLVIIGGDDSNTNAAFLAEYFVTHSLSTCVVGVPKTIDGDLKNRFVPCSFGFDTACKVYSELIGNICRDALSAKKYTHFIKLMGRSASHVTLECAFQTHPNLALLGEEIASQSLTLEQIVEQICHMISQRAAKGRNYNVILLPEGLIEFIPEIKRLIQQLNRLFAEEGKADISKLSSDLQHLYSTFPTDIQQQLLLDRDPHGNVQVSHIATDQLLISLVRQKLQNRKFTPVGHFLGYEGRSGYPTNFDANYCYALGHTAVVLISSRLNGYMSVVQQLHKPVEQWVPAGIPLTAMMDLEMRKGEKKPVIKKALVDLHAAPFRHFAEMRETWSLEDQYRFPGAIQYFGPPEVCNELTITLQIENQGV